jgi:dolichol-phosphate mannosyltransferase
MSSAAAPAPLFSVVVPLFNEEDNVPIMVREIQDAFAGRSFELILVDDGSTDATVARIPQESFVRVIEFEKNAGQSAALFAGIMAARGGTIVLLDGDLQNDPADAARLIEALDAGADLACGFRARRLDSWWKRWQSRLANWCRQRLTRDGVRDTGCTLKAMRRRCVEALVPFHGMHRFIPALMASAGYRVVELPVNHRARRHGVSKYSFGNRALRAAVDLLGVTWLCRRRLAYRLKGDRPAR